MKKSIDDIAWDVQNIRDTLISNITKMLNNREQLEDLREKTEELKYQSRLFKKRTHALQETQKPWYRSRKFMVKTACIGFLMIAAITILICGITHVMSAHIAIRVSLFILAGAFMLGSAHAVYKKL